MGHSKTIKSKIHERLMRPASKRFPEKGFEDVAIADLMKEVGLTVGGFCKYFDSREALVVESLIYVLCGGPR